MADRKSNPAVPSNQRKGELKRKLTVIDYQYHAVTDMLSQLLEMAKAGELDGFVFAARRSGRGEPYLFGKSGRLHYNQAEAIGAAVLLQNKLLSEW